MRYPMISAVVIGLLAVAPAAPAADEQQGIVLRAAKPYEAIEAALQSLGGQVTYRFENVDAVAATVPRERLHEALALLQADRAYKDTFVAAPSAAPAGMLNRGAVATLPAESVRSLDSRGLREFLSTHPKDYNFNNAMIGAELLQAAGNTGTGVIVAVIDSGTANSSVVPAIEGDVIGGENFVPFDPVTSATSRNNAPHGTWVGTVISSNVVFGLWNIVPLVRSLKLHQPNAIVTPCPDPPTGAICGVAMVGVAPDAKLYALKVFPSSGGGAPQSRIMAAMDRALTLKRNYNNGLPSVPVSGDGSEDNPFVYDSLNIEVVNLSLGGPTLFAGKDLEDELTLQMIEEGIVLAVSAGNDGFAAMTGSSPGSGQASLTVGAANTSIHERVLRDLQYSVGIGALYRPTTGMQTAYFSARGPTPDGRADPDLTTNGFATLAQGTCESMPDCSAGTALAPISLVSGTSFSSPTVAGAAALLRKASPGAQATQIRRALIDAANPSLLNDGSGMIDQGRGFLDIPASVLALNELVANHRGTQIPMSQPNTSVARNILPLGFTPITFTGNVFTTTVSDLKPGQVAQFFVPSTWDTDQLRVTVSNITPQLPPSAQNVFFGDDLFLQAVDAPTSFAQHRIGFGGAFVNSDSTFAIEDPQRGLVRVALQGDWTNAGHISARLRIERTRSSLGLQTAPSGPVGQGEFVPVMVEVPAGTSRVVFETSFAESWARYPTNDIDMILIDPDGMLNFDGATASCPERAIIDNPAPGLWTVLINGFTVQQFRDWWILRVTADGVRLFAE
jgi:subtilisin family serine protease